MKKNEINGRENEQNGAFETTSVQKRDGEKETKPNFSNESAQGKRISSQKTLEQYRSFKNRLGERSRNTEKEREKRLKIKIASERNKISE